MASKGDVSVKTAKIMPQCKNCNDSCAYCFWPPPGGSDCKIGRHTKSAYPNRAYQGLFWCAGEHHLGAGPDQTRSGYPGGSGKDRGVELIRPAHAKHGQAADQRPRSNEFDPTGSPAAVGTSGAPCAHLFCGGDFRRPPRANHRQAVDRSPRATEVAPTPHSGACR